jgi:hypothetical protein
LNKSRTGKSPSDTDLSRADLSGANLNGVNLNGPMLNEVNFSQASLMEADLSGADLGQADLYAVDLSRAHLNGAILYGTDLTGTLLIGADLSDCRMGWTKVGDVDLSLTKGLGKIAHEGPSTIGIDTIYRSAGNIPKRFLRGAGVPQSFIDEMKRLPSRVIIHVLSAFPLKTEPSQIASTGTCKPKESAAFTLRKT